MKFRTDFVTNSSSSSFIAIKVITGDGTFCKELENPASGVIPGNGGYFDITRAELDGATDLRQILEKMCRWFYDTIEDPQCWDEAEPSWANDEDYDGEPQLNWEDCKHILKSYSYENDEEILSVKLDDVKSICIFSRMEFWDDPYGARLIEYDRTTKQMKVTDQTYLDADEDSERDSYGMWLYDRFEEL